MKKYIVREGDTMWSISKMTGVRLNLLMAANPQISDPNQLQPGDVISIPELNKQQQPSPHSVQPAAPGSTPSMKPHSTTPDAIPGYFGFVWPHVVKQGETWESIAQQHGVAAHQLQRMNPELANRPLGEGDIVYVPSLAAEPYGQGAGASPQMDTHGAGTAGASGAPVPGLPMPTAPGGTGAAPAGTPGQQGATPTMPGYPGGQPMPGYPGSPSGMPSAPGYPGAPGQMQTAPGYPGSPGATPSAPGYPGVPGTMPTMPGYPQQGMYPFGYGAGPNPYRDPYFAYAMSQWPYTGALPYGPYGGVPPYAHGGMSAEAARHLWAQSQQVPPEWLRDWDESSSFESGWESDWEPQQGQGIRGDLGDGANDKRGNGGADELGSK